MIDVEEMAGLLVDTVLSEADKNGENISPIECDALYDSFVDALSQVFPEPLDMNLDEDDE